jgi:hypothetical protein
MTLPDLPVTPSALARELHIDAKRLRAWLRKQGSRVQLEAGQPWELTSEQALLARAAFTPSAEPSSPGFDPRLLSVGEILHVYASLLAELRRRGLVRTNNAPIGDLAEYACAAYYQGDLAPNSEKSYDLLSADGRRVQIKVRNVRSDTRPSASFSSIRSADFDICVFVLVDAATNSIQSAYEWTPEEVKDHGRFTAHTNSLLVRIGKVRGGVAGVNITEGLNIAWQEMLELST